MTLSIWGSLISEGRLKKFMAWQLPRKAPGIIKLKKKAIAFVVLGIHVQNSVFNASCFMGNRKWPVNRGYHLGKPARLKPGWHEYKIRSRISQMLQFFIKITYCNPVFHMGIFAIFLKWYWNSPLQQKLSQYSGPVLEMTGYKISGRTDTPFARDQGAKAQKKTGAVHLQ